MKMEKKVITKEDGRRLTYFWFDHSSESKPEAPKSEPKPEKA